MAKWYFAGDPALMSGTGKEARHQFGFTVLTDKGCFAHVAPLTTKWLSVDFLRRAGGLSPVPPETQEMLERVN